MAATLTLTLNLTLTLTLALILTLTLTLTSTPTSAAIGCAQELPCEVDAMDSGACAIVAWMRGRARGENQSHEDDHHATPPL